MKIVHILSELRPSGAELMYCAASEMWRDAGIEMEIISTGQDVGKMAPVLESCGYRVQHIPFTPSPSHIFKVYKYLKMRRFDIVHLDTERGNLWYGLAAYFASRPHIFRTVHNIFPFTGQLRARRKLQRGILRSIGVKSISISPTVQAMELERFNNETELVANWFDSNKYHPATPMQRERARKDLGLEDDTFVICTVAGCWPYKNHDAILRALSMIHRETRIVYLHAGMEPSDHPERKLAEELGIADRVRFLGIVPDVLPVLHASDAYLMPSLWEGFGCAAIEAMGAGVPPILAQVAGLRDFKEISPDISWVEPTAESIADGLIAWYQMPRESLHAIGRQISVGTHSKYGLENGARKYAELYQECGRK